MSPPSNVARLPTSFSWSSYERTRLSPSPSKGKVMEIGVVFTRVGVSGRSTYSTVFRHLYQFPRLRPCGQRRARSGRLTKPRPPCSIPALGTTWRDISFYNQSDNPQGLEQEKLQNLWCSAFGALTPVFCLLLILD